MDILADLYCT